jgi:aspartyl aminopeptidase
VTAIFDNEEVGSQTAQGADSDMLVRIIERISTSFSSGKKDDFERSLSNSFFISADMAHACHPNCTFSFFNTTYTYTHTYQIPKNMKKIIVHQ